MELLKEKLFDVISRIISVEDFEKWLYSNPEIIDLVASDEFIYEIVCLNYKEKEAFYNLEKLVLSNYDYEEFLIHLIVKNCDRIFKYSNSEEIYGILNTINSYCDFEYGLLTQFYALKDDIDLSREGFINEVDVIIDIKKFAREILTRFAEVSLDEKKLLLKNGTIKESEYPTNKKKWFEFWK